MNRVLRVFRRNECYEFNWFFLSSVKPLMLRSFHLCDYKQKFGRLVVSEVFLGMSLVIKSLVHWMSIFVNLFTIHFVWYYKTIEFFVHRNTTKILSTKPHSKNTKILIVKFTLKIFRLNFHNFNWKLHRQLLYNYSIYTLMLHPSCWWWIASMDNKPMCSWIRNYTLQQHTNSLPGTHKIIFFLFFRIRLVSNPNSKTRLSDGSRK